MVNRINQGTFKSAGSSYKNYNNKPGVFVKSIKGMKGKYYIQKAINRTITTIFSIYFETTNERKILNDLSKDNIMKTNDSFQIKIQKEIDSLAKKNIKAGKLFDGL